jgi:hypothetical protein
VRGLGANSVSRGISARANRKVSRPLSQVRTGFQPLMKGDYPCDVADGIKRLGAALRNISCIRNH